MRFIRHKADIVGLSVFVCMLWAFNANQESYFQRIWRKTHTIHKHFHRGHTITKYGKAIVIEIIDWGVLLM